MHSQKTGLLLVNKIIITKYIKDTYLFESF